MNQRPGWLLLGVLCAGCVGLAGRVPLVGDCSITADLACETAYAVIGMDAKPAKPTGDTCDNCGGTGKVGDGRVAVTCAACGGTGKKKTSPKASAPTTKCLNGACVP